MSEGDFEVRETGIGGEGYAEETRDPDMLLDCIRRLRTAAAAERRASKSRAFLVEASFLEDGTITVVVCDPEGDRQFERSVGVLVVRAMTDAIAAATRDAKAHQDLQADYESLEWHAAKVVQAWREPDGGVELHDALNQLAESGREGWEQRALAREKRR